MLGKNGKSKRSIPISRPASAFSLLAVAMLCIATWRVVLACEPLRWPQTIGEVTESQQSEVLAAYVVSKTGTPAYESRFFIKYDYTVDGRQYASDRIDIITQPGRRYSLTGAGRFPVGRRLSVRYDRSNPSIAVLEVNVPWGAVVTIAISIFILALALPLLHSTVRVTGERGFEGAEATL